MVAPAAHQSGPIKRPLERVPPRSRAHAPSSGFRLARGLPHERNCSHMRVRAFNALTQQSRAITRLGITPRRCFANSLGEAHPRHCGGLCDEAGVSSVTLCRPLLYGYRTVPSKGGQLHPRTPFPVTLQGQTMTSCRRERHPRRGQSCAAIPGLAVPRRALLQPLQRC
jgi:hypothetical protein